MPTCGKDKTPDWKIKTWTVSEIMAENPCYTEARVRRLFEGRRRLSWKAVLRLKIPSRDKTWLIARLCIPAWTERVVTRAITTHALKCGMPKVEQWAAGWLAGEDRTVEAAGAAAGAAVEAAAGVAGTVGTEEVAEVAWGAEAAAWAAWAAGTAGTTWAAEAAAEAAAGAADQEYRRQVQDFRELL